MDDPITVSLGNLLLDYMTNNGISLEELYKRLKNIVVSMELKLSIDKEYINEKEK